MSQAAAAKLWISFKGIEWFTDSQKKLWSIFFTVLHAGDNVKYAAQFQSIKSNHKQGYYRFYAALNFRFLWPDNCVIKVVEK